MMETMGVAIGIGVFALVLIYLGCLMWKKEKITLLHSYHYDKVSPSDKKVFCKIPGYAEPGYKLSQQDYELCIRKKQAIITLENRCLGEKYREKGIEF